MKKILFFFLLIVCLVGGVALYKFFISSPKKEIADPKIKEILTRGKILVGTEATYPPMEFLDENGNFAGFDIDLAKEIAADLGVEVEFINIPWEKLFEAVIEGKVDMAISSITITPERMEILNFSDPYFNAGQVIVTKKETPIEGVRDLQGKVLGVQRGTTSEEEAKKHTDPSLVKSFPNYELAKEALKNGEVEAIIIDYPAALAMVAKEKNFKIVGPPFTQEFYGIAIQKGQEVLLERVNKTIKKLKQSGTIQALEEKWFVR